ncbi:DUF4328 domain-containing protein [Actinosynnema sp. NPDC047251]|uniref:DUF4328 domain-containing protein n=1 Tax=Saccharothrix espanaensis (strain ATCC 51144 / DSM 44229 / JCM 9112 / NBRC 15066 / NRRL 15764) TaxID=1179773 RepID=K0JRJ9_SACES|nr:DUF4328 domain-containing protein [Saccharothrix espanaensis]CCH27424.1 hypothetical protein BN6_00920 [Saccharothrix espanaensis DSM 44229]
MALQPMRVDWVASPPPGAYPHRRLAAPPRPYGGPPSYPVPPRWGFPLLAWRWPTSVATDAKPADSVDQVQRLARTASHVLALAGVMALWAAGSEVWRYVLLLLSRHGALAAGTVDVSDAMVRASSTVAAVAAAAGLVLTLLWLRRARGAAASAAGYGPSRSDREVLAGVLVPGVNLVVPGSIAAELEHAALRLPVDARPRPSRLVRWWWGLWSCTLLFTAGTIAWSFRSSVQALADGVLLHAVADLLAAAVAILTAVLVRRITSLLLPVPTSALRRMRVVGVKDAPEPALRSVRASGSPR